MKANLDVIWSQPLRGTSDRELQEFLIGAIPKLRAFARMMTSDATFADDLVHQTVQQAWSHRDDVQDDPNSTAWLFQILRTWYYADPRRGLIDPRRGEPEIPAEASESTNDPSSLKLSLVRAALSKLPDHHREVLVLVSASGFDYEEVSRILGCPLGTVKSRLSRARKSLEQVITTWSEHAAAQPQGDDSEDDDQSVSTTEDMPSEEIH